MEDIKTAVARVAAGLASGEMKEVAAVMVLESLVADHTRDRRSPAYVLEKLAESLRRWDRDKPA